MLFNLPQGFLGEVRALASGGGDGVEPASRFCRLDPSVGAQVTG